MIPIVTPEQMGLIDAAAPDPTEVLIGRAGWAVARAARNLLGGTYGRRIVVIAGKGNNGADGRVAGRLLTRRGARVVEVDPSGRPFAPTRPDSGENPPGTLPECDLVIDAAFGTGLSRPYLPPRTVDPHTPVLAVDIPSGISGLTGTPVGEPLVAVLTVTFAALKPGLICGNGPDYAGRVEVADIGLDTSTATAWLVGEEDVRSWLPERPRDTHKWRSAVRVVAGSPGMMGASALAGAGAFRAGAGYVRRSSPGVDPAIPGAADDGPVEMVTTPLARDDWAGDVLADIDRFSALAVGPGLGDDPAHAGPVAEMCGAPLPVVIDGDGLRALGEDPAAVLVGRPTALPPVILTPHDGEFVRLGGDLSSDGDRFSGVRALARRTGAIILHKGPTTLIAHPDGRLLACTTGDAALATAGTGDVLTGVIAAFLARGLEPFEAAGAAAWVHGRAALQAPPIGLVASDLPTLVQQVLAG